jgi:DNA (cytosine-5)-methyltransferase 1
MSEAAAYFGVPVAIARRDRKIGSKKRKQHEIEAERTMVLPFEGPQPLGF